MRCVPLREVLLILQAHLRALLHNQVYFKLKWSDCGFFLIEKKKKNSCKFRPKVVWISEDQEQIHPCFLTPLGKFSSNSPHISLPEPWLGAGWSKVQALLCTCTGLVTVPWICWCFGPNGSLDVPWYATAACWFISPDSHSHFFWS